MAGAIGVDQAEFNNITGNFINNSSAIAGAILNTPNSVIGSINGSFYGNTSIDNGIETGMPGTAAPLSTLRKSAISTATSAATTPKRKIPAAAPYLMSD